MEEEIIRDNTTDSGHYKSDQIMKWVGIPSLGIMLIVAIMLRFKMISLMSTLTIVGVLAAICLITKFSVSTDQSSENREGVNSEDEKVSTASNQGVVLLAFFFGLSIFIVFTLLISRWVIYSFNLPFNFWVGFPLGLINLFLWALWVKHSFDQKLEGAILVQLKLNGKYMKWGKNMRPAWWGICKVTPFIGWLEGKLEKFSEETTQITHEDFVKKDLKNKEDGAVVDVKVNDIAKKNFPVVVKFVATMRAEDTYIIATTEGGIDGARKQLIPKIFGGLVTILNQAKDSNGIQPKDVEDFEPIRPGLTTESTTLIRPDFKKLGHRLVLFSITAVEPTSVEEDSRAKARAEVAKAVGEVAAETVKVKGTADNVELMKKTKISPELALGAVLAVQSDTHRQDTTVTATSGGGKKGGGNSAGAQAGLSQAALFAAMDNDGHKHGGNSGD